MIAMVHYMAMLSCLKLDILNFNTYIIYEILYILFVAIICSMYP